jgi:hypothetical protein
MLSNNVVLTSSETKKMSKWDVQHWGFGTWVAFLKQPALPGEAPQTKQKSSSKIYLF